MLATAAKRPASCCGNLVERQGVTMKDQPPDAITQRHGGDARPWVVALFRLQAEHQRHEGPANGTW